MKISKKELLDTRPKPLAILVNGEKRIYKENEIRDIIEANKHLHSQQLKDFGKWLEKKKKERYNPPFTFYGRNLKQWQQIAIGHIKAWIFGWPK